MRILAIETSCDETSAAVVEKRGDEIKVLSLVTSSSLPEHAVIGGIIPEKAARRQLEYMLPVVEEALQKFSNESSAAKTLKQKIDAIAVTQGPGLIGSLLVGVECAKTLSFIFDKPLIPVNHLLAHIYANFIFEKTESGSQKMKQETDSKTVQAHLIAFPFIGLIVSGGHTDLLYFKNHGEYEWLGGTRDDAVGEALDKIGRRLGLSYPGGPEIEKRAKKAEGGEIKFKSPLLRSNDFDFSYSGLKTEVARYIDKNDAEGDQVINMICNSVQKAAFEVLVEKTVRAATQKKAVSILVGGGVAANETLKKMFENEIVEKEKNLKLYFPEKKYTVDNAAMIGAFGLYNYKETSWRGVKATPEMYFA